MLKNWLIVAYSMEEWIRCVQVYRAPCLESSLRRLPPLFLFSWLLLLLGVAKPSDRKQVEGITAAEIFASICFSPHVNAHVCVFVCVSIQQILKILTLGTKVIFRKRCCCAHPKPFAIEIVECVAVVARLLLQPQIALRKYAHLSICPLLYNY